MEAEGLEVKVKVLQDCVGSLSQQQNRMREASMYLEQRVRELERRLTEQPQPGAGTPVVSAAVPDVAAPGWNSPRQSTQTAPEARASKPSPNGADETTRDKDDADDALIMEYTPGATLWDAPLVVGLPELGGFFASLSLMFSLLLNAFLQGFVCYVIRSPDFTQASRWKDLIDEVKRWRLTEAHKAANLDASDVSLVDRVCHQDGALAMSGGQAEVVGVVNTYLGLDDLQLDPERLGIGPLLCTVCILFFSVLMMRELRSLGTAVHAVCSMKRGPTHIQDGHLTGITRLRLAFYLVLALMRLGVALVLLYTGILWLASTSSITDLILNAAALGFVLDMDEFLFEVTLPGVVHKAVAGLAPLRYKAPPCYLEAIIPTLSLALVTIASIVWIVAPNVHDMTLVKKALCDGTLNFIIAENPAGFVIGRLTTPFSDDDDEVAETIQVAAVKELAYKRKGDSDFNSPKLVQPTSTMSDFERNSVMTSKRMGEISFCTDMDSYNNGQFQDEMPNWFWTIRFRTNTFKGVPLYERPFRCVEHASHCDTLAMMRTLCPITCGCADPLSGLALGTPFGGCPTACQEHVNKALQNMSCNDLPVSNTPNWTRYWKVYERKVTELAPQRDGGAAYAAYVARKIALGCNDTTLDLTAAHDFCDETAPILNAVGLRSIQAFCPSFCCRRQRAHHTCPTACAR